MKDHPTDYSHKRRLAEQCADARETLATADLTIQTMGMAAYCSKLESLLTMVCDSATHVLDGQS